MSKKGGRVNFFSRLPFFQKKSNYEPWYNNDADYNTNAKSYYDYLARFNHLIRTIVDMLNRVLNRNIEFNDTKSIDFEKIGDWVDNGGCEPNHYDDIINVSANVIISKSIETLSLNKITGSPFFIPNGSIIKDDGLWSPDYVNALNGINGEIGEIYNTIDHIYSEINNINNTTNNIGEDLVDIKNDISNIKNEQTLLRNAIQKIVNNLFEGGAINNNNVNTFTFVDGRTIANGNINLFGGVSDGNSFIRTNKSSTENDITAGY